MLRSTIVQEATPIYSATWSPDSNQILFTSNRMLVIKSLSGNIKSNRVCYCFLNELGICTQKPQRISYSVLSFYIQWKAHEGLILKVSWNVNNNLIISGGEDCRYKVKGHIPSY